MTQQPRNPAAHTPPPDAQTARYEGAEDATDSAMVAKAGNQAVADYGTSLGAAASGVLMDVDIDAARLRLRDVQTALTSLGCYGAEADPAADIDGIWGPRTRDAVLAFQQDHDLDATGQLDGDTYEAILNSYEEAMSTQAPAPLQDDFSPMHAESPLRRGTEALLDAAVPDALDDTTQEFLELQDDADLQRAADLENLQERERSL